MPVQPATGADQHLFFAPGHKPGPKDPSSLKGNEDDARDYHSHGNKPACPRYRYNISETDGGYGDYCEVERVSKILNAWVHWAFHKIEQSRVYKENYDYAYHEPGDIHHPTANESEEKMVLGDEPEEPEDTEDGQDSNSLDDSDIIDEVGWGKSQQYEGGHYCQ